MPMGYELLATYAEAREELERERVEPPTACPFDGTPLVTGPAGELHCRFDGYQYPRDGKQPSVA